MKIRTLDWDLGEETLEMYLGGNGDLYVTIEDAAKNKKMTVRVGGCGSGAEMPSRVYRLFWELAREFKKYEDCEFDKDAALKEMMDNVKPNKGCVAPVLIDDGRFNKKPQIPEFDIPDEIAEQIRQTTKELFEQKSENV
jgi:hypothetical protein